MLANSKGFRTAKLTEKMIFLSLKEFYLKKNIVFRVTEETGFEPMIQF